MLVSAIDRTLWQNLVQAARRSTPWLSRDVLVPLLATRLALLLVGWFSRFIPPALDYLIPEVPLRGWHFTTNRLLDIWGRWDTGWYFTILQNGYQVTGDGTAPQPQFAFFPLYPHLIKLFSLPLPPE